MPEDKRSLDTILAVLVLIFGFGVAWATLGADIEVNATTTSANSSSVQRIKQAQKALAEDVADIKTDVSVIRNNQTHFTDRIDAIDANVDRILDELIKARIRVAGTGEGT